VNEAAAVPSRPDLEWDALYARHAEELVRFVLKLVGDRELAADLVHDTFVRAMRSRSALRDPLSSRAWLYAIAANRTRRELRRRRLMAFIPFFGDEVGDTTAFDDEAAQVRQALRSLNPDQAIALVLHYERGFSRIEIAKMTKVGEEAVKSRLARGRANFIAAYRRLERGLAR
jgi:RNA polymerase sigma-70 factor (ECF subfamily)